MSIIRIILITISIIHLNIKLRVKKLTIYIKYIKYILNLNMLNSVLSFWFPTEDYQNFWFDKSKDDEISQTFTDILGQVKIDFDRLEDITTTYDDKLAAIIVLDQFSRSIYRKDLSYNFLYETNLAYQLAQDIIKNGADTSYPISYRLFILLPYRHLAVINNNSKLIDIVIEKLDDYERNSNEYNEKNLSLIERFRNATYRDSTLLTDRITRYRYDNNDGRMTDFYDVLDNYCKDYGLSSKTDISPDTLNNTPLYNTMKQFFKNHKNIGVSLSGGVDSMVILYILKALMDEKCIKNVYALHLSYHFDSIEFNRESDQSLKMIGMYCSLLNVPLYNRKIEYCREKTERNFYEQETKNTRFATYRYLSKKNNIDGWCLGHHHGDVGENVIMNLCNGRSLLDLHVMDKISQLYNVTLYRPLLDHPKSDIYLFAHLFMIPYLKDTTPDWSCRGVLRRKVFPPLIDQYPSILNVLDNISNESLEWKTIVNEFILDPIKKNIVFDKLKKTATMDLNQYNKLPRPIWSCIFLYIFHSMGIHMISHKNLDHFCDTYNRNLEKKNRFMFSNNCVGIFMTNKHIRIILLN